MTIRDRNGRAIVSVFRGFGHRAWLLPGGIELTAQANPGRASRWTLWGPWHDGVSATLRPVPVTRAAALGMLRLIALAVDDA